MARIYNHVGGRLLRRRSGGRLFAAAVAPIEHGDDAIAVMGEAKELGLVCTVVPPALKTRNLDHPDLDRFYAAAAEMDMALGVHGAPGIHLPKLGVDRFTNYIQVHCISFPFDQMTAMTALVSGGVFDRHPTLRVAFLEAGVGWLPWFMERLGEHYESRGDWIPNGWRRPPAEYVAAGNVVVTCEPDESGVPHVVETLGDECIMFASDYPHWDGAWPHATTELLEHNRGRLSDASLARVAGANARRFYGLKRTGPRMPVYGSAAYGSAAGPHRRAALGRGQGGEARRSPGPWCATGGPTPGGPRRGTPSQRATSSTSGGVGGTVDRRLADPQLETRAVPRPPLATRRGGGHGR